MCVCIYVCTRVGWKVHRVSKILSWNITKWDLFFSISSLRVHTYFSYFFRALISLSKDVFNKIWHHMNVSAYEIFNLVSLSLSLYIYIYIYILLYIDLRPGQTCHSKVMHWKEVTHSDGSNEKKSRWRIWMTKWDKVKAHDTLIDWFTGREWPLNCMTVISAWWRSNMPFQRLSGRLNYYITRWGQEVRELETRCGRESHQPAEGALGPPDGV